MDEEVKKQKAEAFKKIKNLQKKRRTDSFTKADQKELIRLQKFRNSLLPSQKKKVAENVENITDAALTAATFIPLAGAGIRGAQAIMYTIKNGKKIYKVGKETFKSLDKARQKASELKGKLPPKAKGNLSQEARGRENITRQAAQKKDTANKKRTANTENTNLKKSKDALNKKKDKAIADTIVLAGTGLTSGVVNKQRNKNKKPTKTDSVLSRKRNIDTRRSPGALGGRVEKGSPVINKEDRKGPPTVIKKVETGSPTVIKKVETGSPTVIKKDKKSLVKITKEVKKGPARSVAEAQRRGLSTFTNKAGKKLAAVTKEQLKDAGFKNTKKGLGKFIKQGKELDAIDNPNKKKSGGKVYRRGGGQALRGFGKATYSNKMY